MDESKLYGELTPSGGGDPIPLLKRKLLIGRRPSCDITLRFPNVSSHHCELELINGYWFVRDLGSANGIKVNDSRCDQKWVFPGDTLTVAKHRFEMSYHGLGDRPEDEEENPFARSLMEKAGLTGGGRRKRIPEPVDIPKVQTDDDVAMEWLMGDQGN
jgi:pSer/pThr/pTyr-binding forkhead associated (FHA) protein